MLPRVQQLISDLSLLPHPEGGYYRESYRSTEKSSYGPPFAGLRNHSTCIYFLLTSDNHSAFHHLHQDEIWHFYEGSSAHIHVIHSAGTYARHTIGNPRNHSPQVVIPGGTHFAAEVAEENAYLLVGCTVAPGFEFEDFKLSTIDELMGVCPEEEGLIRRLTQGSDQ